MDSHFLHPSFPPRHAHHKQVPFSAFEFWFWLNPCYGFLSLLLLVLKRILGFYGSRMWVAPESNGQLISTRRQEQELQIVSEDCATKKVTINCSEILNPFI